LISSPLTKLLIPIESQFEVNVLGLVFFTIALIPLLDKSSEKKVVNISSMLGDLDFTEKNPWLHFSSYSSTKAAVTMANAKFHLEYVYSPRLMLRITVTNLFEQ
jgi:NAD(P)-dependent dehydrogenase (short-subunit alcohol dehydrogenase family)